MQLASFKEFIAFDEKYDYGKYEYTEIYLKQLNSLIGAEYLDEFLMKAFSMIMIVPKTHEFDFEGFENWKSKNEIAIDINKLLYVISFGQK